MTLPEARALNDFFLNGKDKPVVYVSTFSNRVIHILFDKRIHIKIFDPNAPLSGGGKYILVNPRFLEENTEYYKKVLACYFPVKILETPDTKWKICGIDGYNKRKCNRFV